MTISEERKIRNQIAYFASVRTTSVLIFKIEEETANTRTVYARIKGLKYGAQVYNERVLYIWRVT